MMKLGVNMCKMEEIKGALYDASTLHLIAFEQQAEEDRISSYQ